MMRAFLLLPLLVLGGAAAAAQGRPVLMRLCNDTSFAVGVAAAYDTNPSGGRRAEGWFRVEANACLEGAIHGVVGDRMALAAFSGTWQWPAGEGDFAHCLPAEGFDTGVLDAPPCGDRARRIGFTTQNVRHFRQEWGVVDWRIGCSDLGADADLCAATPAAVDGMAEPLRTVELCVFAPGGAEVATAAREASGFWRVSGWTHVENETCAPIWRGFPDDSFVHWMTRVPGYTLAEDDPQSFDDSAFCVSEGPFAVTASSDRISDEMYCPPEAPHATGFTSYRFARNVSHYQAFLRRRQ